MQKKFIFHLCAVILLGTVLILPSPIMADENAGLLLLPTRIVLGERNRNVELLVKNNGGARGLYRIEVIDMDMQENGAIQPLEGDKEEPFSAKKFIHISPRQMILEPDQTQTLRVIVRKPSGLEDGEYRAHIKATVVENNVDPSGSPISPKEPEKGMSVAVKTRFSIVIPVLVMQGQLHVNVAFGETKLREENGAYYLDTEITREGNRSGFGDITVTYQPAAGDKPTVVKYQPGLAVYRPMAKRKISLPLDVPKGMKIANGKLIMTYTTQEKDGGALLAQKEIGI